MDRRFYFHQYYFILISRSIWKGFPAGKTGAAAVGCFFEGTGTAGMPFEETVEKAVDYCIKNNILGDFLSRNRAEAIAVSIFEYEEEKHMKSEWGWYRTGN